MPLALAGNAGVQPSSMNAGTRPDGKFEVEAGRGRRTGQRSAPEIERTKEDKQNWNYVLRTGLAGGLAGCAAKTVVGPLDRVKLLFQSNNAQFVKYTGSWKGIVDALRAINQEEGLRGLFRGHSATLLRIFPYAGIKFLAYEQIRAVTIPSKQYETHLRRFVSGSLAGMVSVFFTYPLEVIRVRLAFETKKDSRSSLRRIYHQIYHEHPPPPQGRSAIARTSGGITSSTVQSTTQTVQAVAPRSGLVNFYRGFTPTLVGMLPYAGTSFLTHDAMGDWLRRPGLATYTTTPGYYNKYGRIGLNNTAELVSGAVAGLVSQTVSYPLEVIRRRMQVGGAVGSGKRLRMGETARLILAERGWRGFFIGLGIGYTKVVPMVAVSFWTYEKSKQALGV